MRLHEILRSVGLEQQLLQKAMRNPGSKVGSLNKQFNSSHANFCHASPRWSKTREPSRCSDFHQRARPDLLALVAETNGNQVSLAVMRAAGCGLMTRGTVWHVQLVTVKLQYLWREKRSKSVIPWRYYTQHWILDDTVAKSPKFCCLLVSLLLNPGGGLSLIPSKTFSKSSISSPCSRSSLLSYERSQNRMRHEACHPWVAHPTWSKMARLIASIDAKWPSSKLRNKRTCNINCKNSGILLREKYKGKRGKIY